MNIQKPVIERKFANAIIIKNGKVLMVKKKFDNSYISGEWHFPGGKANLNESYKDCLIREVKEETGLSVRIVSLTYEFFEQEQTKKETIIWSGETYICFQSNPLQKVTLDYNELSEYRWISIHNVMKLIGPRSKYVCGISNENAFFSEYIVPSLKGYVRRFFLNVPFND